MHKQSIVTYRRCLHVLSVFSLLICTLSEWHEHHYQHFKWLVNGPPEFYNTTYPTMGYRLEKDSSDKAYVAKADWLRVQNPKGKNSAVDFENLYALENYFWGMRNGLALELGALDGSEWNANGPSQTGTFVEFGWNRILVEANPTFRQNMIKLSPESFSVNAAICNERALHYMVRSGAKAPTGGIVEFMVPSFISQFYPFLIPEGTQVASFNPATMINWTALALPSDSTVVEVMCVTLQRVLDRAGVSRVNFMVLDVEGAELDVLESIDWRRTYFDVICVETEATYRPKGYPEKVKKYLTDRGYAHVRDKGRNSWFVREGFQPSKRPAHPAPPPNRHGD